MFGSPTIDDFNRNESPLSDSGQWIQQYLFGPDDYSECSTFLSGTANTHDFIGNFGPAIALRYTNPGPATDQEAFFVTHGPNSAGVNQVSVVLRADFAKNFYEFVYTGATGGISGKIWKWAAGTPTLLASGTAAVAATSAIVGATAIGTTLTGYARTLLGSWTQVVTTTDSSYTVGSVGFGVRGLSIGPVHGGVTASAASSGVWVNQKRSPVARDAR